MRQASNKILLAIQFWAGDKAAALDLMDLLAHNEPKHSELADVLFVHRHDCPFKRDEMSVASRKFNCYSWRSRRAGVGWPAGCNDLWCSSVEWFATMRRSDKIPRYKAMFTLEADGVPMKRDWLSRMHAAWDAASAKGAKVAGHWQNQPASHINGNLLLSGDMVFLEWLVRAIQGIPPQHGWDWWMARPFQKQGWANLLGMDNFYATPTMSHEWFTSLALDQQMFWVHGVKDDSARRRFRHHFRT
jgi:hypothetical protein